MALEVIGSLLSRARSKKAGESLFLVCCCYLAFYWISPEDFKSRYVGLKEKEEEKGESLDVASKEIYKQAAFKLISGKGEKQSSGNTCGTLKDKQQQQQLSPPKANNTANALFGFKELEKLRAIPTVRSLLVVQDPEGNQYSDFLKEDLATKILPSVKNVTPSESNLLIHVRVPKTGSTTMYNLENRIAKMNRFKHWHSPEFFKLWLSMDEQDSLLRALYKEAKKQPVLLDRHVYYFNVTRFGFPKAAWMSFVREPVSRFMSWYHYIRYRLGWKKMPKDTIIPPDWWFKMSLDDCIQAKRPECSNSMKDMTSPQVAFFCGHHPKCLEAGDGWSLQRAKRHAENYFSVIGIMEEMPLSLSVLEGYLPRFFKDVRKTSYGSGKIKRNYSGDRYKLQISNATKEIIRGMLGEDIDFYDFLRQRLHLQAKKLGLLK